MTETKKVQISRNGNPWASYEPVGERRGDLHVEYYGGEIRIYRNMKQFYDDEEGISFYYQLDMGAWAILRIPKRKIKDYWVV